VRRSVEQLVDLLHDRLEAVERVGQPEPPRGQHGELERDRGGGVEQAAEQVAQPVAALALGHAEDGVQDHLERDRLHARVEGERLGRRPPIDLPGDRLGSYARMRSP